MLRVYEISTQHKNWFVRIQHKHSVDFDEKDNELDPYMLELWLGNGTSTQHTF